MKKLIILVMGIMGLNWAYGQNYRGITYVDPETKLLSDYASPLFANSDGQLVLLQDHTAAGYLNILDWLEGRVAGLRVYVNRERDRIPYIRGSQAGIFIDEMRVSPDMLNALSTWDIAFIKVFKGPFAGNIGANSAIAIYTKRGLEFEDE